MSNLTPAHLAVWHRAFRRAAVSTPRRAAPSSPTTGVAFRTTVLVAILGGLASSVFAQWYQTWHEEKVWRREQYLQALRSARDKALEANVLVEEMFWSMKEIERAFDADVEARSEIRSAISEVRAGRRTARDLSSRALPRLAADAVHKYTVQGAQVLMLLHQATLPDHAVSSLEQDPSPKQDPNPVDAYEEWASAASTAIRAYFAASAGRHEDRADAGELDAEYRAAAAKEESAQEKLGVAVRLACTRASSRLYLFQKHGSGFHDREAPAEPPLPWISPFR